MAGKRGAGRAYARTARVNEVLRQVLAEHLERLQELDERLGVLTITAVICDPDLRRATVLFSSLSPGEGVALEESRVRLQAAIGQEVRMKRTPQLRFESDPAVAAGQRIDDILRQLPASDEPTSDESD
jgi:ribosome-binding factor A